MTEKQTMNALHLIAGGGVALLPAVEHELEDRGLIVTDDRPYARLTRAGKAMLDNPDREFRVLREGERMDMAFTRTVATQHLLGLGLDVRETAELIEAAEAEGAVSTDTPRGVTAVVVADATVEAVPLCGCSNTALEAGRTCGYPSCPNAPLPCMACGGPQGDSCRCYV